MNFQYTILLLILLTGNYSYSQTEQDFNQENHTVYYEKLYLHTDREFYFLGDTLWFATYLVDGQNHVPINYTCNIYVDLINSKGEIIQNQIFLSKDGSCPGYLSFSDTLKEGNYLIRAYTDYLENFGEDSFFTKAIKLSEIKNALELDNSSYKTGPDEIEVLFFPEGGFLLANQINCVAFKATSKNGNDLEISGKLLNENGEYINSFKTVYKGRGSFYFIPQENETYKIEIDGYPDLDIRLDDIKDAGAKLSFVKTDEKYLYVQISTAKEDTSNIFHIVGMHRGTGTFQIQIPGNQANKTFLIETEILKDGINRLVLLNQNLMPVSERLVFQNKGNQISVELQLNKNKFETREKVTVQAGGFKDLLNESAKLSMVVVNENFLNASGISQNIKSYLLIDSELKGNISAAADFFVDDEQISSDAKLNLLMLTNGWRNYIWNNNKIDNTVIKIQPGAGISFKGKTMNIYGKKILKNAEVNLMVSTSNNVHLYSLKSDSNGIFEKKNISFYDTAIVIIQSKNSKNKPRVRISLDPFPESADVSDETTAQFVYINDMPVSMYRLKYLNEMALREFYPDRNTRLIEQIDILGNKPEEDDGNFRIYDEADLEFTITNRDIGYANIEDYLKGRVYFRPVPSFNSSATPLYLLDGIRVDKDFVNNIHMANVDKIEIIKQGPGTTVFGFQGIAGVVSVFLKKGEIHNPRSGKNPGILIRKIMGFAPYREFYSPVYASKNLNSNIPDFRNTLYWNPNIVIEDGQTEVSFYTCDNISNYRIFVEGITESGRICLGNTTFTVDRLREPYPGK